MKYFLLLAVLVLAGCGDLVYDTTRLCIQPQYREMPECQEFAQARSAATKFENSGITDSSLTSLMRQRVRDAAVRADSALAVVAYDIVYE